MGFGDRVKVLLLLTALSTRFAVAEDKNDGGYNWHAWQAIVVHDRERLKPLDTLARETILELTGKAVFTPEAFSSLSPAEIRDWATLADKLKAPAADGPQADEAEDGRRDRFKSGDPGVATPATRVRDLVSIELRRQLREVQLASDVGLAKNLEALEANLLRQRGALFERDAARRTLAELREEAQSQSHTETLELFQKYDSDRRNWLKLQSVKAKLIVQLNALLGFAQFYEERFWVGVKLPDEASQLIAANPLKLSADKLSRLNRLLLSIAFPTEIASPPATAAWEPTPGAYDPVVLYMTWLFTWNGWDQIEKSSEAVALDDQLYLRSHKADGWDHLPFLTAGYIDLAPLLLPETAHKVSAWTVREYQPFVQAILKIDQQLEGLEGKEAKRQREGLGEAERRGYDLAHSAMLFRVIRQGLHLRIAPPIDGRQEWVPLLALLSEGFKLDAPYDASRRTALRTAFFDARRAFNDKNPKAFNEASFRFTAGLKDFDAAYAARISSEIKALSENGSATASPNGLNLFNFLDWGKEWDAFPSEARVEREILYNHFDPFWKTSWLAFTATLILAISLGVRNRIVYYFGLATLFASMGMMAYGIGLRVMIAGRPPVTNMFETIIWASFVSSTVGVVLGAVFRQRVLPFSAALLLALANLMAVNLPPEYGASITPLMAVLRSQKWLIVHVMTIVASYGAFMLAWLLGLIGLGYYLTGRDSPSVIKPLVQLVYSAMQVGVFLLAAGTMLGGWWAADSWGRFWGWDPKEVWALIALLSYLVVLHSRFVGVKQFGTLVGAVLAFTMVVASWYGVNFIFPAGLHAYAFNTGGQQYVVGGVILNLFYVALAGIVRNVRRSRGAARAFDKDEPLESETVAYI